MLGGMDDFEKEVGEAFEEVVSEGMPINFRLSGEQHTGIIMSTASLMVLREPGYEGQNEIIVYCPRIQFSTDPSLLVRENLEVATGPQVGMWTVTAVNADLAHFIFTCKPID